MKLFERLQKSRAIIAGAWAGPDCEAGAMPWADCLDSQGRRVSSLDEGAARFSVTAAIAMYAASAEEIHEAWEALADVAAPVHAACDRAFAAHTADVIPLLPVEELKRLRLLSVSTIGKPTFDRWLGDPVRQVSEVLKVFDRAILKAKER